MAELTWVAKTADSGKIYHKAESKAELSLHYVVYQSCIDEKYHILMPGMWWQAIEGECYKTAVEAKQACQRREDALAEGATNENHR